MGRGEDPIVWCTGVVSISPAALYFLNRLMSESSSENSSSESSGSSSLDEASELLVWPIFLKKSRVNPEISTSANSAQELAISRAERQHQIESREVAKEEFDGVDDTDNVDPEQEFALWRARERERKLRDRQKWAEAEEEKEEALRRQREALETVEK